jgi:hypothetical protein
MLEIFYTVLFTQEPTLRRSAARWNSSATHDAFLTVLERAYKLDWEEKQPESDGDKPGLAKK